jgi:hypothetical protein
MRRQRPFRSARSNGGSTRSSAPHLGVRDRQASSLVLLKFYGKHWHSAQAAVVIPGAGCVNDRVGYLAADAPVIASLRHGATCAEAENINKPQEPGMPHPHGWFKQSLDLLKPEARLARALVELDSRHAVAPQICSRHGTL